MEDDKVLYTIEDFWIPKLGKQAHPEPSSSIQGWSFEDKGLDTFTEAPLTLNTEEFGGGADVMSSSIILVSAPGAVGKSTLAKQIAFNTGSVYLDLATAEPVGANTLTGGLARLDIYSSWRDGNITALIDGLDEAVLRTSKEAFEAFLSDVAELSVNRKIPTVLFGRTGVVQDAWLALTDICDEDIAVLEIGYYGPEASLAFAESRLTFAYPNRQHHGVDRQALELLLDGLRNQTASDGDRFAGYAPVLHAVAERVAQENNPSGLVHDMQQGLQPPVTLHSVVSAILEREQSKLASLPFKEPGLADKLFTPDEQLDRLVARVYHVPDPKLPTMLPEDEQTYSNALETWVGEHPFLDGDSGTSSAVFQAVISTRALKSTTTSRVTLDSELSKGDAANPFLYVFYLDRHPESEINSLPEEHIGVIYSSLRASLAQGETASLLIEEPEGEDGAFLPAEVEIELTRRGTDSPNLLRFNTGTIGPICLGSHVKDVVVNMPHATVEIGQGSEVILVAPIDIECEDLAIFGQRVVVDNPPDSKAGAVSLQADKFSGTPMSTVPLTRNSVRLSVSWPGVDTYPWNSFATERSTVKSGDPRQDEALRRFRMFVVAFRARGGEGLARSRSKIESARMTKGTGRDVLKLLIDEKIVSRDHVRYHLDAVRLAEVTDSTYGDCMAYQFGTKATDFIQKALR